MVCAAEGKLIVHRAIWLASIIPYVSNIRRYCEVDVRISKRGQITIPKRLRERFGLHPGIEVGFFPTDEELLMRKRVVGQHPLDKVAGILDEWTLDEGVSVDDYIEEIRGR